VELAWDLPQVVDLERLSQGAAELERRSADLGALVRRVVDSLDILDRRPVSLPAGGDLPALPSRPQ
jgi:hypothetical protein